METPEYEEELRPRRLVEFIGQERVCAHLVVAMVAATKRGEPIDHILLHGPTGLGKTTLAYVIGNEMSVPVRAVAASGIPKSGDLVGILANLTTNEVLVIDEIHRLPRAVEELLSPALHDFEVRIEIGQGPSAKTVNMRLERFTLIGITTEPEFMTSRLRSQFGIVHRLEPYAAPELEKIIRRSARILSIPIDSGAALEIAQHSHGVPQTALWFLRRTRDFAEVQGDGTVTSEVVRDAFKVLDANEGLKQRAIGTPREPISDEVRIFVWQRDRGGCVKCGSQERIEFDHIIPLAKGGSNTARNIQLLCETCNRQKGVTI